MTLVERFARLSTQRPALQLTGSRVIAVGVAACISASLVICQPSVSGASTIDREKAAAAILYRQVQETSFKVQQLGQKYDLAHLKLTTIVNSIKNTHKVVQQIEQQVHHGNAQLTQDAIFAYITAGSSTATNPLFTGSAADTGAANVYSTLAEGNVGTVIANLDNERLRLTREKSLLHSEVASAAAQNAAAAAALNKAHGLQVSLQSTLNSVKGQIANYYAAIARAAAAKAAAKLAASEANHPGVSFVPGPDPAADVAIRTAESFLGTWYCWGGASRSCVDCSGLIMLAYDAAGIYFPHYSGAMYEDTQRVPLWDIQPGDLLFYGYDGDEHVAMYVGHGDMIEAEMTGTQVHITPIRLDYGFWGLGRPRA